MNGSTPSTTEQVRNSARQILSGKRSGNGSMRACHFRADRACAEREIGALMFSGRGKPILSTERLWLRLPRSSDFAEWAKLAPVEQGFPGEMGTDLET